VSSSCSLHHQEIIVNRGEVAMMLICLCEHVGKEQHHGTNDGREEHVGKEVSLRYL